MSSDDGVIPTDTSTTWWNEEEDLQLLIQTNNDRPFLATKNKMKAWDATAASILKMPGFNRTALDGKKASQRFGLLVEAHRQYQSKSKYMSGCSQEETEKIQLLDELTALVDDQKAIKNEKNATNATEKEQKQSATALIRDQAMQRSGKRKSLDGDEEGTQSTKRKSIIELQQAEIELEKIKYEFKARKLEADIAEQALARQERIEMRELELKRHNDMMELIKMTLNKN
ncbi:hypothetical protein LEN26_003705 [Aphanomyces euteiches]|nr:hypothetical protein LEN26_003705 [Aphanomyces euteiches]